MQRITRHRQRPDTLRTEVRSAKRGRTARFLYLALLALFGLVIVNTMVGELLVLQGQGMVTRRATVVTPSYQGTVEKVIVDEGDTVDGNDRIAKLTSRQMRDRITEIRTRLGAARADLATAEAEVERLEDLLEPARRELRRARDHRNRLENLRDQGLATNGQGVNVAQAVYSARKEVQTLKSKLTAAEEKREVQQNAVNRAKKDLQEARDRFDDGVLMADKPGVVTSVSVREGAFVDQGKPVVEIMHGEEHVLAYVPTGPAYSVSVGDRVILRYGMRTVEGHITKLKPVARRLPAEFQQAFHSVQRERLVRIDFADTTETPPMFTKLTVTSPYAPQTLFARAINGIYGVGGTILEASTRLLQSG